ncbi:MAG: hypothetical protein IKZ52_04875 [Bacteroidales bacterium]|nr:hypothetical protein [Bacteroidales bacterium]
MKNIDFIEQSRRDNTHEVQLTPYKAEGRSMGSEASTKVSGRSMGMVTIILLALSLLAVSCTKPEKKELAGTWRWTRTTGGIGGWCYTPESEGFDAQIVFKGSQFTFYKNGKKVVSGIYQIVYEVDESFYTNKGDHNEPFYSWFNIRFHLTEAQWKKMSEATNGTISLGAYKLVATLGYSEADGEVLSLCDECCDGFCNTFVKQHSIQ